MQVAATKPSLTFFQPEDIRRRGVDVWTDDDEWDVRLFPFRSVGPLCAPQLLMLTVLVLFSPRTLPGWPGIQRNYRIGDPILHIELRRWADIVLIAPCSANTLAKIATGICDNLVVSPPPPPAIPLRAQFPLVPTYIPPLPSPRLRPNETKRMNE